MTEENSSMDWSACLYYLRDKRRFDYFDGTAIQGCTECLQISHPLTNPCLSCHRNFKCRPWRRKSILNSVPKWSWLSLLPLATLFLLLTNIFQGVFHVLSRTNHLNKRLKLRPVAWGLLFVILFGANCLPLVSCQESLQPTPSFKSQHLPNAVVYVGSAFIYNISENAFDCEVDSIVVSETADRFLSNWLAYDSHKKQLYGVPTDKDEGMYNILVVALTKDGRDSGHVCGSRSFFIKVVPVSEEFPVSVYPGAQTSSKENKSVQSLPCVPGTQVVQGTVILNADMHSLNGHERMVLVLKMADHLNMHSSRVSLFSGQTSHPIIGQLDNPTVVAAGAGDGRFAKGSRSLLTWHASCGAVKLENLALSKLEAAAQDGTISSLLGVPVVGWHVMSGAQKGRTRHRVRRQVIGVTATPMTDIVPPSRMSNISTSIIISRTVTLTSVFIRNSSIQLSTSVLSSVAPNRTDASSPSTGLTSTVSSQPINRTDILSSSINNVTSSTMGISPSSIHFTETLVVNSSSVVLSRNMTVSIKSSTLLSSINRTTLIRSSSVLPPSLNSTFITRTATSYVSSSVISTLLLSTSRTQNGSSIALSPNETTTFASGLVTVPSVNSTGLTTSSTFTTSLLNQTLSPSTSQVNRSPEVMRTSSSFAVSSSTPTPIISSSSFLSIASPSLTTPRSISRTISSSQLNATTSTSMSPTLTRSTKLTPTLNISSSFAVSANSSVLITSAVNQTFVSTRIQASNSSSMFSSSVTMSSSSSLETLPNTTTVIVGNESSSLVVSSGPRSSPMVSTSLQNRTSATPMSTPSLSIVPTLSSIISTLNTTVQTVSSTVINTSSLVSPSFKSSVTVLSSSVFLPTSPVLSSSSSVRVNVSTVNRNFTSSSLQPNVTSTAVILSTSPVLSSSSSVRVNVSTVNRNFTSSSLQPNVTSTAVILSSFTASPVVTSLNVTSMVISVNASTTKRTPLVNSTSIFDRSSFATITTSAFSPTGTIGSRTFPSTFADNRTVTPSISTGVDIATVNLTTTPVMSTNLSSLRTSVFTSLVISSTFSPDFKSSKMSSSLAGSSSVGVNSSIISRTRGMFSSAATRLVNSSVDSRSLPTFTTQEMFTTVSSQAVAGNSTTLVSPSSQLLPNGSLPSTAISSSSEPVFASSTFLLPKTSSASDTSVSFPPVRSSVLNSTALVPSMSVSSSKIVFTESRTASGTVGLVRNSSVLDSSLVISLATSRTLTIASRSSTILSSARFQNATTVLRTTAAVSPSITAPVRSSSLVRRSRSPVLTSSFGINGSVTVIPSSTTVTPTFTVSVTATPGSSGIQNTSTVVSFTEGTSVKSTITPVFTSSTLQTGLGTFVSTRTVALSTQPSLSSSRVASASSGIPSSVQPSATVAPVNRTAASSAETSGLSTVMSRTANGSTLVKMTLSVAPTVGSRKATLRLSSSQIRSTIVTLSNASSVTPLVTVKGTNVVVTPSSVGRSVSSQVTQVDSSAFTSLLVTSTRLSIVTQTRSSLLTQTSKVVTRSTSMKKASLTRSVTPYSTGRETPSRFTLQSSRAESTQIRSSLENPSVTSTVISRETIGVTSLIPNVTSSFQTNVTLFISKPLSVTSAVVTPSAKSQTPSVSVTFTVTSRATTSVTSTLISRKTISVTSLIPSVSFRFQASVTPFRSEPLSVTSALLTSRPRSQMISLSVTSTVTLRETTSVSALVSAVTSGVFRIVTSRFQTSVTPLLSKPFSDSPLVFTESKITSVRSIGNSVTQSSGEMSSETALPSQSPVGTLMTSVRSSTSLSSSRQMTVRTSLAVTTTGRLHSSRSSQVKRTTVAPQPSRSQLTTGDSTVSLQETLTLSSSALHFPFSISSVLAAKSTAVSRISTLSAVSFSSRKSSVIINSSFDSSSQPSFFTSRTFASDNPLPLASAIITSSLSHHFTSKSQNLLSSSRFSTSFSVLLSTFSVPSTTPFSSKEGTLPSSSIVLPSSNTTQIVTPIDSAVTFSITPSSTVIIPTTAPPNSPPQLYNNMGRVSAPAGKALYFTIPDDTFYDSEDKATTRDLSLSVLLADGTSIPSDFWLQFDATSQTIYGLPLSEHVPSGVIGEGFILRAQDSQGAQALDAFEVLVVPSEEPVVQELRIRITNNFLVFNGNVSQRLLLLQKIAEYYDDPDKSRIRVLTFSPGSVIMTWTNDSLPTDRCDEEKVNYVANKLLLPDGGVKEEFKDALQGFPVESASEERHGVCNGSESVPGTPIGPAQQSTVEENIWYKHVLVGVLIALIILVLAALLIWYCRRRRPKPSQEKRTYKKRKPIILEPEIELTPIRGKPLILPDDDPSKPPSYMSETSLDKPVSSDDEDEVDYGKRSPSVVYEPPPPFHATLADDPQNSPPPAYLMPPMYLMSSDV